MSLDSKRSYLPNTLTDSQSRQCNVLDRYTHSRIEPFVIGITLLQSYSVVCSSQ